MKVANINEKVKDLPQVPGVYIFRDAKGKIIYVGKATSLRSRVGSYFASALPSSALRAPSPKGRRGNEGISLRPIEMMIAQVADIEVQETESVLEALILEANLIKKHQPKYNVLGKDDKSYAYFVITKEEFPKVMIVRKTDLEDAKRRTQNVERKTQNAKRKTWNAKQGDPRSTIHVSRLFGPYTSKKQMEIALKIVRKIFPFHSSKNKTEKGCLDFQLGRCPGPYAGAISKADYAKNIRGIQMILEGKKKSLLKKMEKEMSALAKKEEFEKATEVRNKIFALQHIQDVALISSGRDEALPRLYGGTDKFRIEAYDISNISGQQAVGSMVVFENGEPNKKEYRKFKIKTVEGANDVAMMQEVLSRRLNNAWTQPDLILLDGGAGHVNMAADLLSKLGFAIPIVGVAKGKTRKNLNFQFPPPAGGSNELSITKFSKEIKNILDDKNLIKTIMDEAHRFAITYHRKVRKSEFI
ncbi:MAG: GIY-YIG nuclease family protein [Candidatus Moranbacteria bacterium]|nr:GIY-YIG nuclease family protein [Candidatus Moranbacteria bacterium]